MYGQKCKFDKVVYLYFQQFGVVVAVADIELRVSVGGGYYEGAGIGQG